MLFVIENINNNNIGVKRKGYDAYSYTTLTINKSNIYQLEQC